MAAQAGIRECLPPAGGEFGRRRREHWDALAARPAAHGRMAGGYHARLAAIYSQIVPRGAAVLEIGCGKGDLLAAVCPAGGVGVDFAPAMVAAASRRHPGHAFMQADAIRRGHAARAACNVLLETNLRDYHKNLERLRYELEKVT